MLGRGTVLAADAARSRQLAVGIERIVEGGHAAIPLRDAGWLNGQAAAFRRIHRPAASSAAGRCKPCMFYAAFSVSPASVGRPSSIGSDGSRDHSFQEPKYIRTSFTPAFFSARKVFEARAPLKQ